MESEKGILSRSIEKSEFGFEKSIRPQLLSDYVGQEKVKAHLALFLEAAKSRKEPIDHCLLAGPPGLGKTTLAHIIAQEMRSKLHVMTGPSIDKKGDLAAVLTNLALHDVLFIDEIHRLPKAIEEILYSAMEDFKLDLIVGQGPSARTLTLDLPVFTLVGATTKTGLLSAPLRDRFGIQLRLNFYPPEELARILLRSAYILGFSLSTFASQEIARRARGTPRVANRLLRRLRDFVQVHGNLSEPLSQKMVQEGLDLFEVDGLGLDALDRLFLHCVIEKFDGGPVGIDTLAYAISEESHTLEDVVEPYLMQEGLLKRTPRGRIATSFAYQHLGIAFPERMKKVELHPEVVF